MPNAFTGNDLPPNEQEAAALRYIAQLRAAGMSDEDIFGGFTQGGGSGYLPYITDMAGIQSSYNLGRGNLALNAQQQAYQMQGNPYNVVTALQYQRDNPGSSGMLTDPTLGSIQPSGAGIYGDYINRILNVDNPAGGGGATVPPTTAGAGTGQFYGFNSPEEAMAMRKYFDAKMQQPSQGGGGAVGAPPVSPTLPGAVTPGSITGPASPGGAIGPVTNGTNPMGQSWIDAWRAYRPGQPDPVPGYATSAANTGAQQAGARLLGSSLNGVGVGGQFRGALDQGKVPGFSSLNERQMSLLSPDQQQSYLGLVASTGRVSDPAAAYRAYLNTYQVR